MVHARRLTVASIPLALAAGIGAGAIAALINIAVLLLSHSHIPPVVGTAGSSVVAGALAGLVYTLWTHVTARPAAALWITCLLVATIDTVVLFALPFPTAGREIGLGEIAGLVTPLLQIFALFGVGGFSAMHMPSSFYGIYIVVHYLTAVVASVFVPVFARPRGSA